jgi:hypothetical protein
LSLGAGNHSIAADYLGDSSYIASTTSYTQVVDKASLSLIVDNQSMTHFGPLPAFTYHYSGFINGDVAATSGINASVSLSAAGSSTSSAGYYAIDATVNSFSSPNYVLGGIQRGTLTIAPTVTEILVGFGHKTEPLGALSRKQQSTKINAIDVIFSDNVDASESMLHLLGVRPAKNAFRGFQYNSSNFEATWKLRTPIAAGVVKLSIDGEAAVPAAGAGPPINASPFSQEFSAVPAKSRKSTARRLRKRTAAPDALPGQETIPRSTAKFPNEATRDSR